MDEENHGHHSSTDSSHPYVIQEVSEPSSPDRMPSFRKSIPTSALAKMIRNSSPSAENEGHSIHSEEEDLLDSEGGHGVTVSQGIISQPTERTTLLLKRTASLHERSASHNSIRDLESQKYRGRIALDSIRAAISRTGEKGNVIIRRLSNPKSWNKQAIWTHGFRQPFGYVPPVMLGVLLNILDALSYGEIEVEKLKTS